MLSTRTRGPKKTIKEALQPLLVLGHKRQEAERMVQEAAKAKPNAPDAETLVRVTYRKQQEKK